MRRKLIVVSILALTACGDVDSETPPDPPRPTAPDTPEGRAHDDTARARRVLFVGTSLTAGYGVGDDLAWPARIGELIDSAGLDYDVVNAGISGETSAGGLRRIDWSLQQPADVLVLELGANDGLRGLPVDQLRSNLDSIMTRARRRYPAIAIVLAGMEAPPNLGSAYTTEFRRVFPELARRHNAALIPFLLDSVAARPEFNQADGVHPNEEGHRRMARTAWPVLEPVLRARADQPPSTDRFQADSSAAGSR